MAVAIGSLLYLAFCLVLGAIAILCARNVKIVYALILTTPRDVR